MSLPLTPCYPSLNESVEERICAICGETRYSDEPDFEEGRRAYAGLPAGVAGRWACPGCVSTCVGVTRCHYCFDRLTNTGSVPTQACLRCDPGEFGPRFAAYELERLMSYFERLDKLGRDLPSIEVANLIGSKVMRIREVAP